MAKKTSNKKPAIQQPPPTPVEIYTTPAVRNAEGRRIMPSSQIYGNTAGKNVQAAGTRRTDLTLRDVFGPLGKVDAAYIAKSIRDQMLVDRSYDKSSLAPSTPIKISTKSQPVNAKEAAQLAKEIAKFNKTYAKYPRPVSFGFRGHLPGNPDLRPPVFLKSGDVVYGSPLSGRTPEGGTRSLLEGLRNWIGGGPGKRTK